MIAVFSTLLDGSTPNAAVSRPAVEPLERYAPRYWNLGLPRVHLRNACEVALLPVVAWAGPSPRCPRSVVVAEDVVDADRPVVEPVVGLIECSASPTRSPFAPTMFRSAPAFSPARRGSCVAAASALARPLGLRMYRSNVKSLPSTP